MLTFICLFWTLLCLAISAWCAYDFAVDRNAVDAVFAIINLIIGVYGIKVTRDSYQAQKELDKLLKRW